MSDLTKNIDPDHWLLRSQIIRIHTNIHSESCLLIGLNYWGVYNSMIRVKVIHRGSYNSAHVELNLLNEEKR